MPSRPDVAHLNSLAGHLLGGVLLLAVDRPALMAALLSTVGFAAAAVLQDSVAGWCRSP